MAFLLPGSGHIPVGGFKVTYEYAQHLSLRGHRTCVVHASWPGGGAPLPRKGKALLGYLRRRITGYRPTSWFSFRAPVAVRLVPFLHAAFVPAVDVLVATAWQTAEWLGRTASLAGRERLYLIQHEETWSGEAARVYATWRLPLRKIVSARWLEDRIRAAGEEAVYIPIGLDFSAFGLDLSLAERPAAHVVSLHHEAAWKGSRIALEALRIVRDRIPQLEATLFGTGPPPGDVPAWCRYIRNPPQSELRRLYNRATAVLSASLSEGWGLVGSEAMMCGAAFVGTDIGGHREFAGHEETALLCPPGDTHALADSLTRLLHDPAFRQALAARAHAAIQRFTWERAADAFERVLR